MKTFISLAICSLFLVSCDGIGPVKQVNKHVYIWSPRPNEGHYEHDPNCAQCFLDAHVQEEEE